jgi:hypothetical protein
MSKNKLTQSGTTDFIRDNVTLDDAQEVVTVEEGKFILNDAMKEKIRHQAMGPLALTYSEKNDPDFIHKWLLAKDSSKLDHYLSIGGSIVKREDCDGNLINHTAQRGSEDNKMIHIKIPKEVDNFLTEEFLAKRNAKKKAAVSIGQKDKYGNIVTVNETKRVRGIPE